MTPKKMILAPTGSSIYRRRKPLLNSSPLTSFSSRGRIAEVAGGATAECAAVWCCCPCSLFNLLILVIYKVPAGICKKALRKHRKKRMMKKGLVPIPSYAASSRGSKYRCNSELERMEAHEMDEVTLVVMGGSRCSSVDSLVVDKDLSQLEEQMWERFYTTGFGKSPSQREKEKKPPMRQSLHT